MTQITNGSVMVRYRSTRVGFTLSMPRLLRMRYSGMTTTTDGIM